MNPHAGSYNPKAEIPPENLVVMFYNWCIDELGNTEQTCRDRANYLRKPLNPSNDHSIKAYRLYYRFRGWDPSGLPKGRRSGIDLSIPSSDEVRESLREACGYSEALCLTYRLLIESGSRLTEVLQVLNNYDVSKDKQQSGGFYVYDLGKITKSKKSFYVFHASVLKRIKLSEDHASRLARIHDIVRPKYIRKWVATRMASLGIPSEVIDFMQGRTPRSILSKHYLNLYALALQQYPKYIDWLRGWMKE